MAVFPNLNFCFPVLSLCFIFLLIHASSLYQFMTNENCVTYDKSNDDAAGQAICKTIEPLFSRQLAHASTAVIGVLLQLLNGRQKSASQRKSHDRIELEQKGRA